MSPAAKAIAELDFFIYAEDRLTHDMSPLGLARALADPNSALGCSWRSVHAPVAFLTAIVVGILASPPEASSAMKVGCFSKPSRCGYPDATNSGVPAGVRLRPSGSRTVRRNGAVLDRLDITGRVNVAADNVTIKNSRITLNGGGCGHTNTCGNAEIRINERASGTVIKNSELRAAPGTTCEHDIRNTAGPNLTIRGVYMHGCDSNLYGGARMVDSYGVAKLAISTDHVENIYFDDSKFIAIHDTLLNPVGQTAVIFGNSNGGTDTTNCRNKLTVANSLLAGGGYPFYPCAHAARVGSSSTNIQHNRFGRCTTSEVYHPNGGDHTCAGGSDSHGFYPSGGSYGLAAYYFTGGNNFWKNNVWDNNLQSVCPDGARPRFLAKLNHRQLRRQHGWKMRKARGLHVSHISPRRATRRSRLGCWKTRGNHPVG